MLRESDKWPGQDLRPRRCCHPVPGEAGQNLNLGEVGVLKFVGEDEAGAGPRLG